MHIPDGLMDPAVVMMGFVEALVFISGAVFFASRKLREKDLPRIAVLSAGVFVAQMLNFPVGGGTTGHLIGGALLAILVGPALSIVGMTVVLLIQSLMFGDGGVTAFGLNALNMAVIAPLTGWGAYNLLRPLSSGAGKTGDGLVIAICAWASVFVAAAACAAELAVSHAVSGGVYGIAAAISIPAMLGYHAVIGIGEGVITAGIISYLWAVSAESFGETRAPSTGKPGWRNVISSRIVQGALSVLVIFALALPLYFLYSSEGADGLEKTMEDADLKENDPILASPLSYGEGYFAALFAGILGFTAVSLAAASVLRLVGRGKER